MNVYESAIQRLNLIFDDFEKIVVSFSGGKDSGVLLNMAIDIARERGRKIGVVFIDLEAFYEKTIEFVQRMIENNKDVLEPMWICLPMESPNALSYFSPTWYFWDTDKEEIWTRPMPTMEYVINLQNHKFDFYYKDMPFEQFIKYFAGWYGGDKPVAALIGIRTVESLNRWRSLHASNKETYKGLNWSTKLHECNNPNAWNFYPIYDWRTEDIWVYNGKFEKDYNKLYDLFYKAGVSIYKMRVDEPFGNEAKSGLNMFRIIEPQTWQKVVNRVSGANLGAIYSGNKLLKGYALPKSHATWKSFTKFLLSTLPEETANTYKIKFIKFIKYWFRHGCPMIPKDIEYLEKNYPEYIINTHAFSNRGNGDKHVIRFKKMLDSAEGLDTHIDVPSWRRLARCILRQDIIGKSIGFSITQGLTIKQKELVEKYKALNQ